MTQIFSWEIYRFQNIFPEGLGPSFDVQFFNGRSLMATVDSTNRLLVRKSYLAYEQVNYSYYSIITNNGLKLIQH